MIATPSIACTPDSTRHRSFAEMTARLEAKRDALAALVGDGSQPVEFVARYRHDDPSVVAGVHLLTRDPSCRTQWRLTHFTPDGPSGHLCYTTLADVVAGLMYTPARLAPGQVDAWSRTARWAEGLVLLAACARFD